MPAPRSSKLLARVTGAVLALAMSAYAAIAPAAVQCDLACGPQTAAESCEPGAVAEAAACCDRHEPAAPANPGDDAPQKHDHRGAGCCPQACAGCVGRALFVATSPIPALTVSARPVAHAMPALRGESFDLACSIFHPPRA